MHPVSCRGPTLRVLSRSRLCPHSTESASTLSFVTQACCRRRPSFHADARLHGYILLRQASHTVTPGVPLPRGRTVGAPPPHLAPLPRGRRVAWLHRRAAPLGAGGARGVQLAVRHAVPPDQPASRRSRLVVGAAAPPENGRAAAGPGWVDASGGVARGGAADGAGATRASVLPSEEQDCAVCSDGSSDTACSSLCVPLQAPPSPARLHPRLLACTLASSYCRLSSFALTSHLGAHRAVQPPGAAGPAEPRGCHARQGVGARPRGNGLRLAEACRNRRVVHAEAQPAHHADCGHAAHGAGARERRQERRRGTQPSGR